MHLDWFVPRTKNGNQEDKGSLARRFLRILRAVAPTWASSPIRRLIQCICLALFLWLFLYVCWPYTAQPASVWHEWLPVEVDTERGDVTVTTERASDHSLSVGMRLHVSDSSRDEGQYLGFFEVCHVDDGLLELKPTEPLPDERLDALAASFGPWSLSERKLDDWPSHYADDFLKKERIAAETFLVLDPLVSISAALSSRAWVWSLAVGVGILVACVFVPRGFCGYVCPLGTLIDLFDWAIGKRLSWFRVSGRGWWVHIKYYLLMAVLVGALFGVSLSGFVAAIPVITRAAAFIATPLQTGMSRDWHQIPVMGAGQVISFALFCLVLSLGFLRPRFWCRYVCPTGGLFSISNLLRVTQRKVNTSCIHCKHCAAVCPFDAVESDFSTRTADCTFCQTCGGVCPTRSITFVSRWNKVDQKDNERPATEAIAERRGFLSTALGVAAGAVGGGSLAAATRLLGADTPSAHACALVRPPGSVPEDRFLQLCVRCGECYQACPNDAIQPVGVGRGLERLWTPQLVADWSGCEASCSNCGQACPTGAIRALPLEEKRVARMGLAVVNEETCLPYAGREECDLCVTECQTAGYNAIEFIRVGTELGPFGEPIEGSGFLAPVVLQEKCVGCGLCQTRCHKLNVKAEGLLAESAIRVEAGDGKDDRLTRGSYLALRERERKQREEEQRKLLDQNGNHNSYLPEFLRQ